MIKLSYVLPCYNVEKYIVACLDSIYNQGMRESDFEVICVNDCSPDQTRAVISDYQLKHDNLVLIDHEKNKRVGAARNTGFFAAKGEYIWFIDPDDVLHSGAALELLPLLDELNLDFVQFGHDWMTENGTPIINPPFNHNFPYETPVITGVDFLREYQRVGYTYSNMHVGCYVRIFRRSFLHDNDVIFPEVAYYEDQYQALHALLAANRMKNLDKSYYSYRVVESSYSYVPMSVAKRASQIVMCNGMYRLMQQYNLSEDLITFVWTRYQDDLKYLNTHFVLFMPDKDRSEFIDLIKEELPLLQKLMPNMNKLLAKHPNAYKAFASVFGVPLKALRNLKRKMF